MQAVEQGDAAQAAKAVEKSKQAAAAAAAEQGDEYNNLFDESEDDEVSCRRCITASCNALHGTGCRFHGSCGTLSLSSDGRQPKAAALHLVVTVLIGTRHAAKIMDQLLEEPILWPIIRSALRLRAYRNNTSPCSHNEQDYVPGMAEDEQEAAAARQGGAAAGVNFQDLEDEFDEDFDLDEGDASEGEGGKARGPKAEQDDKPPKKKQKKSAAVLSDSDEEGA